MARKFQKSIGQVLVVLLLYCILFVASSDHNVVVFQVQPEIPTGNVPYNIHINLTGSLHACETRFLSVTIDTYAVKNKWKQYNFGSQKLQNLASALSPCDIRLGGTYADFLTFSTNDMGNNSQEKDEEFAESSGKFGNDLFESADPPINFTMSGNQWNIFTTFLAKVGWDLMFDFNLFKWKDGLWDTSNADLLLNYSSQRGIRIPYFQLGNEPDSYYYNFNLTISPETLEKDFEVLKKLISKYPLYNTSSLYGPDVTNLDSHRTSLEYLSGFISSGAYNYVAGISFHQYYLNGRIATLAQFLNVSTLDSLKELLQLAVNAVKSSPCPLPILLTETSSCYGGGAPNLSDTYSAGFLWLDKLGVAAQYGVSRVFRQTFLGSSYGLLAENMNPNPDFYLSVLFKRLVEGPVFNISFLPADVHLRVYANCARRDMYQPGAIVIYFLNLHDDQTVLTLPQFQGADLDLYLLTPGDSAGLKSRFVRLNGDLLLMSHSALPPMLPKPYIGEVILDPLSFGFIVVPYSKVALCVKYFSEPAKTTQ